MEKPSTSRIDLTGFQIGDFLIEKYIAEGGMATIYLATQLNLKRKVALKILKSKLSRSPKMLARFNREVETLSSLSHPNIVSIFGKGKAKINNNEHYFFAMEYVSGCNLRYAISQEKLNEIASYRIVLEILEALECAHEKGIIHRDIKPENILLTPQNHIKITDFGIAHLISHEDKVNLTEENVGIGTRSYMAPEQGLDSRSVDARADIYSVGVLLYELLTGVIPHGVFEPASTLNPQLEYPIDPIIFKAMASDREKRYPAAKQMHQEIQDFLKTGYLEIQRKNASPPLPPLRSSPFLSVPLLLILSLPLLLALSFFNPFKLLPPSLELTTLLKHFSKHTPLPENPNPSKTSDSVDPTTTKPPDSVDPTTTKPLDPVLEKTVFLSEAQKFLWIANALIQKRSYESAKLYLEWARREVVLREEVEAQLKRIEREKKEEETCLSLQKHAQILMRVGKIQEALPYLEDMERVRPSLESHILVDRAYLVEKTALASYQEFLKNIFWYMSQARWNQAQEELHRFRETFSELRCLKALQTYLTQMQHQTEKMIVVKGGTFLRGPEPSQKVFVSVFFIDPYETSQGEYALFLKETRFPPPAYWQGKGEGLLISEDEAHLPIREIDYHEALAYALWKGKKLPTEAQWEKAARGVEGNLYPWGNTWESQRCVFNVLSEPFTQKVQSLSEGKSPYECFHMAGNVWEWCRDYYQAEYDAVLKNPQGPAQGLERVVRGGGWSSTDPEFLKTFSRFHLPSDQKRSDVGCRFVLELDIPILLDTF